MFVVFLLVLTMYERVSVGFENGKNATDVINVIKNVQAHTPGASIGNQSKTNNLNRRLQLLKKDSNDDEFYDYTRSKSVELMATRTNSVIASPSNATVSATESVEYKTSVHSLTLPKYLVKLLKLRPAYNRTGKSWAKNFKSLHKAKFDISRIENNPTDSTKAYVRRNRSRLVHAIDETVGYNLLVSGLHSISSGRPPLNYTTVYGEKAKAAEPVLVKRTRKKRAEEKDLTKEDQKIKIAQQKEAEDDLEMEKMLAEDANAAKAENSQKANSASQPKKADVAEVNKATVLEPEESKPKNLEVSNSQDVSKIVTDSQSVMEYLRNKLPDVLKVQISKTDDAEAMLLENYAKAKSVPNDLLASYNAAKQEEREVLKLMIPEAGSSAWVIIANYKGLRRGEAWNHTKLHDRFKALFQQPSSALTEYEALKKDELTSLDSFLRDRSQDKTRNDEKEQNRSQKIQKIKPTQDGQSKAQDDAELEKMMAEEAEKGNAEDLELAQEAQKGKSTEKGQIKNEDTQQTKPNQNGQAKAQDDAELEKMMAEEAEKGNAEDLELAQEAQKGKSTKKGQIKNEDTQQTKPNQNGKGKAQDDAELEKMMAEEAEKGNAEDLELAQEAQKAKSTKKEQIKTEDTQQTKPKQNKETKAQDDAELEKMLAEEAEQGKAEDQGPQNANLQETEQNRAAESDKAFERRVRAENGETLKHEDAAQTGEAEDSTTGIEAPETSASNPLDSSPVVLSHASVTSASPKVELSYNESFFRLAILYSVVVELTLAIILVVAYRKKITQWCRRNQTGSEMEPLRPHSQHSADGLQTTTFWMTTMKNTTGLESIVKGTSQK